MDWVEQMCLKMVMELASLSLRRTPMADTLKDTAKAWRKVFVLSGQVNNEEIDKQRFRVAYKSIISNIDLREWPAPGEILKRLPKRPPQPAIEYHTDLSPEENILLSQTSAADKERMAKDAMNLVQNILSGKDMNPDRKTNERARKEQHRRESV